MTINIGLISILIIIIPYFVCLALTLYRKEKSGVGMCLVIPLALYLVIFGSLYLMGNRTGDGGASWMYFLVYGIGNLVFGVGLSFVAWILGRWFNLTTKKTIARILIIAISLCLVVGIILIAYIPGAIEEIGRKEYDQIRISPDISISPDDQHLAFAYNKAIYVADIDGANIRQITHPNEEEHSSPEFYFGDKKIFFWTRDINDKERKHQAMIIDFDGSNLKQLRVPKSYGVSGTVILGNDEKIYFVAQSYDPGADYSGEEIFEVNAKGEKQRLTKLNALSVYGLNISSDGKYLSFFTEYMNISGMNFKGDGPDRFWKLSLDGKGEPELIERKDDSEKGFYSVKSPNGKYSVFSKALPTSRNDGKLSYELFLIDLASKKTIQLTHLNQSALFVQFYHHQDKIIFANAINNDKNWLVPLYEFWEINTDGSGLKKIDLSINKDDN